MSQNQDKPNHIYLIYMYKEDLAINNQKWLICHKTKQIKKSFNESKNITTIYKFGQNYKLDYCTFYFYKNNNSCLNFWNEKKNNLNMSTGKKKSCIIVVILAKVRTLSL